MDTMLLASVGDAFMQAATDVWHWFLSLDHVNYVPRICVALFLGFLIGLERRARHKSAGVRTYMVIAGSAALITLCGDIVLEGRAMGDPTRLAGQIMSGIGMIGAGVILKRGFNASGVTTAAFILLAVGAGIGSGFGIFAMTIIGTTLVLFSTVIASRFFNSKEYAPPVTVVFREADADDVILLFGKNAVLGGFKKGANGTTTLVVQPQMSPLDTERLLQRLIDHPQIIEATLKDAD